MIKKHARKKFIVTARDIRLELGKTTKIMGILNVTPDSFSLDGCLANGSNDLSQTMRRALKLIRDGADIIDIGGESTRPGAKKVSENQEKNRVIPIIQAIAKKSNVPISIDTYKTNIAKHALDAGASIVNNIMGVKIEKNFLKMVKNYNAAIVLMHIKGTPQTMQKKIFYKDLIKDIKNSLNNAIEKCLEIGIKSDKILIDPGIGFGKTVENNLEIIRELDKFKSLNYPILIGTSRKSFIGKTLNKPVKERLIGTIATVCSSIQNGAHIVRVHDVKKVKEATLMTDAIL